MGRPGPPKRLGPRSPLEGTGGSVKVQPGSQTAGHNSIYCNYSLLSTHAAAVCERQCIHLQDALLQATHTLLADVLPHAVLWC